MTSRREEFGITGKAPISPVWEETVAACLAKDPAHRPQCAGEVLGRLKPSTPIQLQSAPQSLADQAKRRSLEIMQPSEAAGLITSNMATHSMIAAPFHLGGTVRGVLTAVRFTEDEGFGDEETGVIARCAEILSNLMTHNLAGQIME